MEIQRVSKQQFGWNSSSWECAFIVQLWTKDWLNKAKSIFNALANYTL